MRYRIPGWIAGVVLGAAFVGIVSYLNIIYSEWGTFDRAGSPPRIDWCGRRYYAAPRALTAQEFAQLPEPRRWAQILTTPSGEAVLAIPATAADEIQSGSGVCATHLYVREGPDRYLEYPLSGGP